MADTMGLLHTKYYFKEQEENDDFYFYYFCYLTKCVRMETAKKMISQFNLHV